MLKSQLMQESKPENTSRTIINDGEVFMSDQINAKEHTLWDLMSGKFIFSIPDYQRPYSWTENEVSTLWDDLVEFWSEGHVATNKNYFLGSVVLVKEIDSPEAEVIDGQQRLTTLSILLSLLKDRSASWGNDISKCLWEEGIQHMHIEGKPRITLRKRDSIFFKKMDDNRFTFIDWLQKLLARIAGVKFSMKLIDLGMEENIYIPCSKESPLCKWMRWKLKE